jgi:hypothetical protein
LKAKIPETGDDIEMGGEEEVVDPGDEGAGAAEGEETALLAAPPIKPSSTT